MPFDKETAAKAGEKSSRKGKPNKTTDSLRKRVENILDDNWERLSDDIESLTPKERVDTIVKLLEYALPKLNRTEFKGSTSVEDYLKLTPKERMMKLKELKENINE
ncbi:hypothetical protein [Croceitalea rosinachiae]|uniref:Uncharacterized protein n=1 Tax=Croceitalea rosinachiae TaxID=3075596 RepID=A0ABU3ACW0_9FLAO|nr:hypothetical protein [Croceitalea sp. F388]MDT0608014.1 hypothetical protein [Croceitalea sp. F388]